MPSRSCVETTLLPRFAASLTAASLFLSACSQDLPVQMPAIPEKMAVLLSQQPLPFGRQTPGTYRIPDTTVIVSTNPGIVRFKDATLPLLAVLGPLVYVASAPIIEGGGTLMASLSARHKTGDRSRFTLDVAGLARDTLQSQLTQPHYAGRFAAAGDPYAAELAVTPYVVLSFGDHDLVRPWVVLNALLKDHRDTNRWQTRVMVAMDEPRPLEGAGGWAEDQATELRRSLQRSLDVGCRELLRIAVGELSTEEVPSGRAKATWLWQREPIEVRAELLDQSTDRLVLRAHNAAFLLPSDITVLPPQAVDFSHDEFDSAHIKSVRRFDSLPQGVRTLLGSGSSVHADFAGPDRPFNATGDPSDHRPTNRMIVAAESSRHAIVAFERGGTNPRLEARTFTESGNKWHWTGRWVLATRPTSLDELIAMTRAASSH